MSQVVVALLTFTDRYLSPPQRPSGRQRQLLPRAHLPRLPPRRRDPGHLRQPPPRRARPPVPRRRRRPRHAPTRNSPTWPSKSVVHQHDALFISAIPAVTTDPCRIFPTQRCHSVSRQRCRQHQGQLRALDRHVPTALVAEQVGLLRGSDLSVAPSSTAELCSQEIEVGA
jgi:hypothetical protein